MSANGAAASGGTSITGLLGVVFVTLKLTGTIDWSWWWVTAPFWVPTALVLAVIAPVLVAILVAQLVRPTGLRHTRHGGRQ